MDRVRGIRGLSHCLAGIALDLEAVVEPALVAGRHSHIAVMAPARLPPARRLVQQQTSFLSLGGLAWIDPRSASQATLTLTKAQAGAPEAVAGRLGDLFAQFGQQLAVLTRRPAGSAIAPSRIRILSKLAATPSRPPHHSYSRLIHRLSLSSVAGSTSPRSGSQMTMLGWPG